MHRLLYLVLGAPDSGRQAIVQDLIEGGLTEEESALTLTNEKFPDGEGFTSWYWENSSFQIPEEASESPTTHNFLIFSPYLDLADQIEASLDLLDTDKELTLARILFVVHCGLLEEASTKIHYWHEACAHYADVALLNRQKGENIKKIKEFKEHYESMRLPFLVESIRKNRVVNPAKILDPTSRRISHVFDPEIDVDSDLADPYLERLPTGERAKQISLPFGEPPNYM
ncbi:MAG: hypothetical protein CMI26_14025 [Opitutae bacterium]|nr:hypothetical protein [Opitutae bacterium]